MNIEDIKNPEFQEKLRSASSPEELLESVSGGSWACWDIKGCTNDFKRD